MIETRIRRSNQKVQLKNSGLQKESNQTEQRNSNCERNKIRLLICTKVKFIVTKSCSSWLNGKRASRRNSRRLNRLIPIYERKDKLKRKSDQKSWLKIIAENPRKRKLTNRLRNERSLSVTNEWTSFVKTNIQTNVRKVTKPRKTGEPI